MIPSELYLVGERHVANWLRLIEYFMKHEGVEFVTMEEIAVDFKQKNPPPPGAVLPAEPGAMLKKTGS